MRKVFCLVTVLVMASSFATETHAQLRNAPFLGDDIGQVTLHLGVLSPQTTFKDASFGESSFANGFALGLSATAWPSWPASRHLGLRTQLTRSKVDGQNEQFEFAPIAINDPTVWLFTGELIARLPMGSGFPYLSAGVGGKHYTWKMSVHEVSRSFLLTAAAGFEFRPRGLAPLGISAELRGYQSEFRAFGIDDGSWAPGFYGGEVGGVNNLDLQFTTGVSLYF